MISWSLVFKAAKKINNGSLRKLTLYGDNQLGNNSNNFSSSFIKKLVGAHDRQESVGIHFFSQSIEEYRKVMEVIQFSGFHWECDPVNRTFMVNFDWQISSVIISSKFSWFNFPFRIRTCLLFSGPPLLLPFIPVYCVSSSSSATENEFIYGTGRLWLLKIDSLSSGGLLLGKVFFGEVTECWMGISGSIIVLPWFKVNIFRL